MIFDLHFFDDSRSYALVVLLGLVKHIEALQ